VEVWITGQLVWDGRVKETPAQEGADFSLSVQCEGWQYHLDDDVFTRLYVRSRLGDWQDARSSPLIDLTRFTATPQVSAGDGQIPLKWPAGSTVTHNDCVGVMLDCGPDADAWPARISLAFTSTADANLVLFARAVDTPAALAAVSGWTDAINMALPSAGTYSGTFDVPRRYVAVFVSRSGTTTTGLR
jgi:hypothetical protein